MTRRITLLCAVLSATPAPGSAEAVQDIFELVPLDEGVYAAVVNPRPPTYVFANALVVVGGDAALVVDTQQSLLPARELLDRIAELTDAPVRYVVNTHWHGDHVYGNQAYRERFAGVAFIGHDTTREDVLDEGRMNLERELREIPASIREREEWLARGRGPDGSELTSEARDAIEYSRSARSRYLQDLRDLVLTPPDLTFSDEMTVELGGRSVRLLHFGPAHTRGDVVVHVPASKVAAVGDLLEDAFPYFGDAYPSGWADALVRITALDADVLLPAHGPVLRDRGLLETETRLLRDLVDEVERAVSANLTVEEVKQRVTLPGFRAAFPPGGYAASVAAAVERAYLEATGRLVEPTP